MLITSLTAMLLMSSGCDDDRCVEQYINAGEYASESREESRRASRSAAGETEATLFPEGDSRYNTAGAGWVYVSHPAV